MTNVTFQNLYLPYSGHMLTTYVQIPKSNWKTDSSVILANLLKPSAYSLPICYQERSLPFYCSALNHGKNYPCISHALSSAGFRMDWPMKGIGGVLECERKGEARPFCFLLLPLPLEASLWAMSLRWFHFSPDWPTLVQGPPGEASPWALASFHHLSKLRVIIISCCC